MRAELTSTQIKELKKSNQHQFNALLSEARKLAQQWLNNGFNLDPRSLKLDEVETLAQWQTFPGTEYSTLFKSFFSNVASVGLKEPDKKAFTLFISAFDYEIDSASFNVRHFSFFINQEVNKCVNGLSFDFTKTEEIVEGKHRVTPTEESPIHPQSPHSRYTSAGQVIHHALNGIGLQILGGFLTVLGAASVALAFVVLNACTLGVFGLVVASLGSASLLTGIGLFAAGRSVCYELESMEPTAQPVLM